MAKSNPIEVQKFLKGIDYPAKKDDLLEKARGNGAKKEILSILEGLKKDEFKSPAEVSKAVAEVS